MQLSNLVMKTLIFQGYQHNIYFPSYKIHIHHTSVCLIFMYRHTNPFIYHNHRRRWRIFISAHENAINGNQKRWTNPKCEMAFFSSFVPHQPSLWATLIPKTTDVSVLDVGITQHCSCCKLCNILGAGMRFSRMSWCVILETKNPAGILSCFLRRKGKANDGTQMQKSFGYIFDALLLWIADSPFLFHIGLVYRAAIYFIFSQA